MINYDRKGQIYHWFEDTFWWIDSDSHYWLIEYMYLFQIYFPSIKDWRRCLHILGAKACWSSYWCVQFLAHCGLLDWLLDFWITKLLIFNQVTVKATKTLQFHPKITKLESGHGNCYSSTPSVVQDVLNFCSSTIFILYFTRLKVIKLCSFSTWFCHRDIFFKTSTHILLCLFIYLFILGFGIEILTFEWI